MANCFFLVEKSQPANEHLQLVLIIYYSMYIHALLRTICRLERVQQFSAGYEGLLYQRKTSRPTHIYNITHRIRNYRVILFIRFSDSVG